jgi:glycosyltransferase involved in cell wall biosynthesis
MRVLWFTGVQLPAVTGEGLNRAGWQEGLRQALEDHAPGVELAIASFGSKEYSPFTKGNATYHNIYRESPPTNRWQRVKRNWSHRSFQEDELKEILKIYKEVQPDLVFIFGTENPFGLVSPEFDVPAVISIQAVINGLVNRLFTGLPLRVILQEIFSRTTLAGGGIFHKWWSHSLYAGIERKIYQKNDYFCGRTEWDKNWTRVLNPDSRYYHIDRVLREPFYAAEWDINQSLPDRLFSLSGNAPFKGAVTLVESLLVTNLNRQKPVTLHLAGVDPDSLVGETILGKIQQAEMEDQVRLLGRIGPDQIIQEMKHARAFILPSHMDNSPNSLAEAMIIGMPCIGSDAGGIPSMIEDGVSGLIYHHQDLIELSHRISQVLDDPSTAEKLGKKAREVAVIRHDRPRIAAETLDMYRDIIQSEMNK